MFRAAVASADVTFATPPCRTYSTAGKQQLDNVTDGKLPPQHISVVLQKAQPPIHVVETPAVAGTVDNG